MNNSAQGVFLPKRLFEAAFDLLRQADPREFYPKVVEFCASLLDSEVCALFVRTTQIGGMHRVCLVAGKLPPDHPKGQRMNPNEVDPEPENHSYRIGEDIQGSAKKYDGVTGRIATTGQPAFVHGYDQIVRDDGHVGKWDRYVWQGNAKNLFRSMLGVAIRDTKQQVIGVIKVENKATGEYNHADQELLEQIGASLAGSLLQLIEDRRELTPDVAEYEYRVPRSRPEIFEKEKTGEVVIKHSMTAICHSDLYYFLHQKARTRLDERLPLVLGHETTGEVYQVVGENQYRNGGVITRKDRVVVIPLIPCKTCSVCRGDYGENYCPSSRFMASNAPGSLRTLYKYYPDLILRITKPEHELHALFTEPMSNVVQMLQELGFVESEDRVDLQMAPFRLQEFTYFHVGAESFSNIFDSVTAEEPFPRTLFVLKNPHGLPLADYRIRHHNIMVKGLGLLGTSSDETLRAPKDTKRAFKRPKVLIVGGGTMGYILAILLREVYSLDEQRIVVTGRDPAKLEKFYGLATRQPVGQFLKPDGTYEFAEHGIVNCLISAGKPGPFDVVFECVGSPTVEANIELGLQVVKDGGVLALEGITEQSVGVDFNALMRKRVFLKGFYRSSIRAYITSLTYIQTNQDVRKRLDTLVDSITVVSGRSGALRRVASKDELAELFKAASSKAAFGRLIVGDLA